MKGERFTDVIRIRMTKQAHQRLVDEARAKGLTVSDVIRVRLGFGALGRKVPGQPEGARLDGDAVRGNR